MIWLRSLLNPYVILGVAIACLFGLWKWEKRKTLAAKQEVVAAEQAKAELKANLEKAAAYNKTLKDSLDMQEQDAEEQAAAAKAARDKERLAWIRLDKLKKEIANATDNPPIPDALESVLDAYRLRSAVPGTSGNGSPVVGGNEGQEGEPGPVMPDPAAPTS